MASSITLIKLQKLIDENETISFDVFDTLLFRSIKKPTDLFSFMEAFKPELFANFKGQFKHVRTEAENVARGFAEKGEVNLNDIYSYVKYYSQDTNDTIEKIKQLELKAEKLLCYANPLALEIFNYALSENKKIIICSDMYLSSAFVCEILKDNNYKINENIKFYVSNEHKDGKHSRGLYKKILSENNINPKKMVHIGDNYISDIKNAKKHKINTFHLEYPPKILSKLYKNKEEDIASSLIEGFKLKFITRNPNLTPLQLFAINRVAPMHFAYFLYLIEKIKRSPAEKVLFFARDCFIYHKLLESLKDKINFNKKYSYFYVSRKSIENEELFSEYLKQECEELNEIALVDLGWIGTIHSKIDKLKSAFNKKINFHGFYMNLTCIEETMNIENFDSFVVNFPRKEAYFILTEIFHASPHPTTLNYEKRETYKPIFEDPKAKEQTLIDTGMEIQNISIEFITMILEELSFEIFSSLDLKKLLLPFFDMVKNPSSLDVKVLGDLTFSAKSGLTHTSRVKISPKIFLGFLGNLNPLYKKGKKHIVWKEGTKKRNFILTIRK